jgi:glycosyltransferase involved in cell wall biosynthesis
LKFTDEEAMSTVAKRSGMLSVVIPAYNSQRTIARAVESAFQSHAFEVVVIDDGSSDATARVAENLGCRVIRQANQGAAQARQNGLEHVTGAIVCFLDSDDQLLRDGVEEALLRLSREPSLVGVVG